MIVAYAKKVASYTWNTMIIKFQNFALKII